MNVYEATSDYLMNSMYNENGIASRGALAAIVTEYDALAPDWSRAPDDARWYTIDANGAATWSDEEPFFSSAGKFPETFWDVNGEYHTENKPISLPLGIDWRLCKWQRPEAK